MMLFPWWTNMERMTEQSVYERQNLHQQKASMDHNGSFTIRVACSSDNWAGDILGSRVS